VADVNARRRAGEEVYGTRTPTTLHVVKPEVPLPLDPDFFAGRISADTLIDMGHRDACAYLADAVPDGVPLDASATAMADPPLGVRLRERLHGELDDLGRVTLEVVTEIRDLAAFLADPAAGVPLVGHLDLKEFEEFDEVDDAGDLEDADGGDDAEDLEEFDEGDYLKDREDDDEVEAPEAFEELDEVEEPEDADDVEEVGSGGGGGGGGGRGRPAVRVLLRSGTLRVTGGRFVYEMDAAIDGKSVWLTGVKSVRSVRPGRRSRDLAAGWLNQDVADDQSRRNAPDGRRRLAGGRGGAGHRFGAWADFGRMAVIRDGKSIGELRMGFADTASFVAAIEPSGAHDLAGRARAVSSVARFLLRHGRASA
jgi:hypothetical protein